MKLGLSKQRELKGRKMIAYSCLGVLSIISDALDKQDSPQFPSFSS